MYPDFQYISFHEQSDRVSFLEGKVFQYGWIFLPISFFTENWKVSITSILMKTAKDLEIIRGDIHIRICKNPYHTSVDVLPRLCCMRPTKSQISLGTAYSYQRLCYEYKNSTFCRAWSGSNLSANNISRRHEDQIRVARGALAHNIKHNCSAACADPERGPTLTTFFLLMMGERIQTPLYAGHHWPASETPFKWRFAGVPLMAQHRMLAW